MVNAPVTPFANTDAAVQSQTTRPQTQLRVVTVPTSRGLEDVVLRLLSGLRPLPLDEIGLSADNLISKSDFDQQRANLSQAKATVKMRQANVDRAKGDLKKALEDGYLRTAVLFRDVKSAQPEALFKAAECFQQMGQIPYAEKMRKRLLEVYPQSPEAGKVRGGA